MRSLSALVWARTERCECITPLLHRLWQGGIVLKSQYPVYWDDRKTGEVTVEKEGLYYRFFCRVQLPEGTRCRLYARAEGKNQDLGLCIPQGRDFVVQTRLPVKHFGLGEYQFCLEQPGTEKFVPVYSDRPFSALDSLEQGKFIRRDEVAGILFQTAGSDALTD